MVNDSFLLNTRYVNILKKKPNANSSNKRFTDSAICYAFIASVNFLIPVRQ